MHLNVGLIASEPLSLPHLQREWIDSQVQAQQDALATWPEHLFEHFFVVVSDAAGLALALRQDACSLAC